MGLRSFAELFFSGMGTGITEVPDSEVSRAYAAREVAGAVTGPEGDSRR
jgi:hypothetical protein